MARAYISVSPDRSDIVGSLLKRDGIVVALVF